MKTPRIHDFDPDAKVPELVSPMDNFPSIQKPKERARVSTNSFGSEIYEPQKSPVPPVLPVRVVPPAPLGRPVRPVRPSLSIIPKKRVMKPRHPFDIYQDQYESLKQLADEERRQGGVGSMSAMVRSALDTYVTKRRAGK